jgi:uncharacterized phage protein gp47/JayE
MPLTDKGFNRLSYEEILEDITEKLKMLFGDDIDTSDNSTFGKIIGLLSYDSSNNQELAENVYLSHFPKSARGVSLDNVCKILGISRNPATYAKHQITITGEAGTLIEMGFLVSAGDVVFHTNNNHTIGTDGTVTVEVDCNEAGEIGNVPTGSIDTVVNPIAEVTSITHNEMLEQGKNVETDESLRSRATTSQNNTGSGTLEAIKSAILSVTGVESVYIEENDTNTTTATGLLPHSFRCNVLAPETASHEIAKAIFSKKTAGIPTTGTVTETIIDTGGTPHDIKFSWTNKLHVYVRCELEVNSDYTDASENEIKNNLINKINSLTNGEWLSTTSLYSVVFVDGVTDVPILETSTNGTTYSTETIGVPLNTVIRIVPDNISVVARK